MINGCPNCGGDAVRRFCADCGQASPSAADYSLIDLWRMWVEIFTRYDGRVWRTVRALLFRPGQMARDHYDGRRARYMAPLRVFLAANVLAWLVIPFLNIVGFSLSFARAVVIFPDFWTKALQWRAGIEGITVSKLTERIDALGSAEDTVAVLLMVPLFALACRAVMARTGYRYVQHFIFAAHFYCIHLLVALLWIGGVLVPIYLSAKANQDASWAQLYIPIYRNLWFQHFSLAPLLFVYLLFAVRRAYALTTAQSSWRAVLLTIATCTIARSFFDIAFALVLIFA